MSLQAGCSRVLETEQSQAVGINHVWTESHSVIHANRVGSMLNCQPRGWKFRSLPRQKGVSRFQLWLFTVMNMGIK